MPFYVRFALLITLLISGLYVPVHGQESTPPVTASSPADSAETAGVQVRADSLTTNKVTISDTLPRRVRRGRTGAVLGTSVLTLGATYAYLDRKWWRDGYTQFHLDAGRDWRYASNIDKFGHLLGGVFTADSYYAGFRWAGVGEKKAAWYAVGATAFVQLSIEAKDGFSPRYGFSWADVAAGTLGGFWPMLQHRSPFLRDSRLKVSYWQRTTKYFDQRGFRRQAFSIDDYINQTYWFSFSPTYLFGQKNNGRWPGWLQLSVGVGLDADTWSPTLTGEGGLWEIYLAPDVDLVKLFRPRKPLLRSVLHVLNYVKVPLPTWQLTAKPRGWLLYF